MNSADTNAKPLEALFRPALILMSGRGLGFIAAFAIPMVLARIFSQEEFGTYKQLFLIYATLYVVLQIGMAESLYYFLPSRRREGAGYVANTLLALAAVGAVGGLLLWLLQSWIARALNNPDLVGYLPYLAIYLLFMLMSAVLEIVMTVKKQHMGASATYAVSDMFRAALYVLPVLIFANLHALMIGAAVFAALRFGATLYYATREFGSEFRPQPALLRSHLAYALPLGLAGGIEIVQLNLHLYAVSWYFDVATFAIYAVGCLQVPLVDFLSTSTCNVMMVNMQEKLRNKDIRAVVDIWLDAMRKVAMIFCPLVFGLLVLAPELIIILFTETYAASIPIFMVWTVSLLFTGLLTAGVLRVFADTRFLIIQSLVHLLLIVSMVHFFLTRFGVLGAVFMTLIATALVKIMALARIKYLLGVSLRELLPWKALGTAFATAALAAMPALLLKSLLDLNVVLEFLLTGFTYSVSYLLLLLLFGPLDPQEKQMFTQSLLSPFQRIVRRIFSGARTIKKTSEVPR